MKRLVWILLLANILVFGWNRGWFERQPMPGAAGSAEQKDAEFLQPVPLALLRITADTSVKPQRASDAGPDGTEAAGTTPGVSADRPVSGGIGRPGPALPRTQSDVGGEPTAAGGVQAEKPANPIRPSGQDADGAMPSGLSHAGLADVFRPGRAMNAAASGQPDVHPESGQDERGQKSGERSGAPDDARNGRREDTALPGVPAIIELESGPEVCRRFAATEVAPAGELRLALESAGARVQEQRLQAGSSYLVYLPSASDEEQARQNLESVRAIGRDDAYIIRDEPFRLGISLGLYRHESAARVMVERLERAGEQRAVISARPPFQTRIVLQARWTGEDAVATAPQLARTLGERFGVAVEACE